MCQIIDARPIFAERARQHNPGWIAQINSWFAVIQILLECDGPMPRSALPFLKSQAKTGPTYEIRQRARYLRGKIQARRLGTPTDPENAA